MERRRPTAVRVIDLGRMAYRPALAVQRATRDAVAAGTAPDTLLLVEHPPVVTLGRRGDRTGIRSEAALRRAGIDVIETERGGNVTYHGPGQLVAYPILDLRRYETDLRLFVGRLERTVLRLLDGYGVDAWADPARHGVFTARGKIASVGVHVAHWVTLHGVALNVDPEMAHWDCIAPCGLPDVRATSLAAHRRPPPTMAAVRDRFLDAFAAEFETRLLPPRVIARSDNYAAVSR